MKVLQPRFPVKLAPVAQESKLDQAKRLVKAHPYMTAAAAASVLAGATFAVVGKDALIAAASSAAVGVKAAYATASSAVSSAGRATADKAAAAYATAASAVQSLKDRVFGAEKSVFFKIFTSI